MSQKPHRFSILEEKSNKFDSFEERTVPSFKGIDMVRRKKFFSKSPRIDSLWSRILSKRLLDFYDFKPEILSRLNTLSTIILIEVKPSAFLISSWDLIGF